jgi:hypothetical protein
MKLIDKKGRLFGVVNLFDLFVILIIISLLAGIYFVFIREDDSVTKENVKVVYELELEESWKQLYIDAFSPGEKVYFKESDIYIGTIREVRAEDAWEYESDVNGEWVLAKSEGFYIITLVIEADAVKSGEGYIVENNWNAFNGTTIEFSTRRHSTLGQVKSLEEE